MVDRFGSSVNSEGWAKTLAFHLLAFLTGCILTLGVSNPWRADARISNLENAVTQIRSQLSTMNSTEQEIQIQLRVIEQLEIDHGAKVGNSGEFIDPTPSDDPPMIHKKKPKG